MLPQVLHVKTPIAGEIYVFVNLIRDIHMSLLKSVLRTNQSSCICYEIECSISPQENQIAEVNRIWVHVSMKHANRIQSSTHPATREKKNHRHPPAQPAAVSSRLQYIQEGEQKRQEGSTREEKVLSSHGSSLQV
ncbi:hypothetical protein TNCT_573751 [Trichonephila clavata]|uniref:Uncharacterized protein n=1 Tax=Trichonephila clavata TaxID=2740835 RepID=A0A8X6GUT1_TRICU|nr:hypothetical protein TNCT_573751 [Trichonephila clavata]